ncbi:MAG TPA: hypothetical protein VMZ90_05455 [Vicinamibacterales bacterium]|nr:hypothetical protein [Vicinamibacterales bacterium]
MMRRLAAFILGKYPTPWRERYEDEVLALMEDLPVRLGDLGELARGLIVERVKATIEPGDSPRLSAFVFWSIAAIVRVAPSLLLILGAAALAELVRRTAGIPSENVTFAGMIILSVVLIGFHWRKWKTRSEHKWIGPVQHLFPAAVRALMLCALFLGTFLMQVGDEGWEPSSQFQHIVNRWFHLWMYVAIAHGLTSAFWPWRPMLDAFSQYNAAVRELRWAHLEVDRWRALISEGVSAEQDLANAQIARDRIIHRRDEASAILHGYGYRARFQQPS